MADMLRTFLAIVLTVFALSCAPAATSAQSGQWSAANLDALAAVASGAEAEGLRGRGEALARLAALRARAAEPGAADQHAAAVQSLDAYADALFLELAHDFAFGATDPIRVDPTWRLARDDRDLEALRAAALAGDGVDAALRDLLPRTDEYAALRAALAEARASGLDERVTTLRANMERLRWMPRDMPASRVEIRIPFFTLWRYADGVRLSAHKVIVGKTQTPTPSFAAAIEAITLNPYWLPPTSIARNEILPALRADHGEAARLGYEFLDKTGAVVPLGAVDWAAFPYTIRQAPGPANALGALKFEMSNPYAIYIHDTPSKALFGREARAFSHGCIRLEAPTDLAAALAPPEASGVLADLIATGKNQRLALTAPVPVYVLYMTTALDDAGALLYANDVYRRDARIARALDSGAPPKPVAAHEAEIRLTKLEAPPACGA